ncbi:MAG: hypothetical protein RL113_708 [Pseudomonadota bacterium]
MNKKIDEMNLWSGRRDSNPRPQPWQGCALPLSYARIFDIYKVVPQVGFEPTRPKAEDFESTKSTSSITAASLRNVEANSTEVVLKKWLCY